MIGTAYLFLLTMTRENIREILYIIQVMQRLTLPELLEICMDHMKGLGQQSSALVMKENFKRKENRKDNYSIG